MAKNDPFFLHLRREPDGPAREIAREVWVVQAEQCRTAVERSLPDAGLELYLNLGPRGRHLFQGGSPGTPAPRAAWVVGPHAKPLLVEKETSDCDMVGVRLRPGAAQWVLGVPAGELRGSLVDLDLLWGSAVETLRDRLYAAPPPVRLQILERFVAARLIRTGYSTEAARARDLCAAVAGGPRTTVGAISAAFGLSHRRVIATFDHHIGLKPKTFQRVERLWRVLHHVHTEKGASWARIAHACGYFDQAHLINDFRTQAGITPGRYAATRSSIGRGFAPYRLVPGA
jgi:AraC-like DNA-binding protein